MSTYLRYFLADLIPILMLWVLLLTLSLILTCGPEKLRRNIFETYLSAIFRDVFTEEGEAEQVGKKEFEIPGQVAAVLAGEGEPEERQPLSERGSDSDDSLELRAGVRTLKSGSRVYFPRWLPRFLFVLIFPPLATAAALYWDAAAVTVARGNCLQDITYNCFRAMKQFEHQLSQEPVNCSEVTGTSQRYICFKFNFDQGTASVEALAGTGVYIVAISAVAIILMFADDYAREYRYCQWCHVGSLIYSAQIVVAICVGVGGIVLIIMDKPLQLYLLEDIAKLFQYVGTILFICGTAIVPWFVVDREMSHINKRKRQRDRAVEREENPERRRPQQRLLEERYDEL